MAMALRHQIEQVSASLEQHADLIDRLRSAPEHEATAILLRLRSTPDVSAVVASLRTSVSPNRLSEPRTPRAVMPATNTEIEFELMVHHKIVYPALPPIDVLSLDLNNLNRLDSESSSPGNSAAVVIGEQNAISDTIKSGVIDPSLLLSKAFSSRVRASLACATAPPQQASGLVLVSANNAIRYCRTSRAIAGFRIRGPWRIYVDPAYPRGLGSLDISSTTIKPILNYTEFHSNNTPFMLLVRQLIASAPSP